MSVWLGVAAAVNLAATFGAQVIVLAILGAGAATDSFIAAQTAPLVAFSILGVSLLNVWQPILSVAEGEARAQALSLALGQVCLWLGAVAVLMAASASIWTPWLFPGFDANRTRETVALTRLFAATVLFSGLTAPLTAMARAEGRFLMAEATPALGPLLPCR